MTDYKMPRGDTRVLTVTVTNPSTGVDLTNYDVWFTLKSDLSVADAAAQLQKHKPAGSSSASGIAVSSPASLQRATVTIAPADTQFADQRWDTKVHWDVQVRGADGSTTTVDSGVLTISAETTLA